MKPKKLNKNQIFDLIIEVAEKMEKRPQRDLQILIWNKKIKEWVPFWLTKDNKLKNNNGKITGYLL